VAWTRPGNLDAYDYLLRARSLVSDGPNGLAEARELMRKHRPAAVVLDILLPGEEHQTWRWLAESKAADDPVPVIVASNSGDERKALSLGADAYLAKPVTREALLAKLDQCARPDGESAEVALIIDDDAAARYVIRRSVREAMRFEEAADGTAGLAAAVRMRPKVIFLDLSMPGMNGSEVLERLAQDPGTSNIPVVVVTSHELDDTLRQRLSLHARAIVQKKDLSVETLARALETIQQQGTPRA